MRSKVIYSLLPTLIICLLLSASVVFAKDALHIKTTFKVDRAPQFAIPFERPDHNSVQKADIPLNSPRDVPTNSPGFPAGLTTYDYQHNGSMGRQVAYSPLQGYVHFVWMAQDDYTIPGNRRIYYQGFNTADNTYVDDGAGINATDPDYSGYASCQTMPDGSAMFGCHTDFGSGTYNSTWYYDGFPPFAIFNYDPIDNSEGYETIWPIIASHNKAQPNVTNDVIYMLTHVFEGSEDLYFYRKVDDGGGGWLDWEEQNVETVTDLSYTVVPDGYSDNVAIVYTDDRSGLTEGEGGQTDLDVYYMLSTNQGASWGTPVNVSNYTLDSLWRAYSDVSAVFSISGYLHIIWSARELRNATTYENYKCRLVHWSQDNPSASIIDEARYNMVLNNRACDPDAWNLYIAKMSISECDGNLYALYTKFGDDNEPGALQDCSQGGFANGELYITASDDYGATWDTAVNLTKTRNTIAQPDGCDSAECESDHWSTMLRYGVEYTGADDTLDIVYINDKDAGGIPQGSGTWTLNNVMHLRVPCRAVVHIPKVSLEPTEFGDPTHTDPGVPLNVNLKVANIGNADMNIEGLSVDYTEGSGWIALGGYSNPINPGNFVIIPITLNVGGVLIADPSGWHANILVDTDSPSDVVSVPVALLVASDFDDVEEDTLETTTKKLTIFNTGRLGGDNSGYSLDIPGDCDAASTSPDGDMYLYDASPVIAWNNGSNNLVYTTMFSQIFVENGTFRPQSPWYRSSEADYDLASCTLSTTDSLYGVNVQLYAPNDGNDFVLASYEFFKWNPSKDASQVYVGMVADWDIPADDAVDNGSGSDAGRKAVWQRGAETEDADETGGCPIGEHNRIGGIAVLSGNLTGVWTAENAPMQEGSGFNPDSLYNRMSTSVGFGNLNGNTAPDPINDTLLVDLHSGLTFEAIDLSTKASHRYLVVLATTNTGQANFLAQVDAASAWAEAHDLLGACDCVPGDANADGGINVGDAVRIINFVFKGGAAPTPYPVCSGDANGDCGCNVGDAVRIINFVFKGGAAPVDCETFKASCGNPF